MSSGSQRSRGPLSECTCFGEAEGVRNLARWVVCRKKLLESRQLFVCSYAVKIKEFRSQLDPAHLRPIPCSRMKSTPGQHSCDLLSSQIHVIKFHVGCATKSSQRVPVLHLARNIWHESNDGNWDHHCVQHCIDLASMEIESSKLPYT